MSRFEEETLFEVVIVEDGSTNKSDDVCNAFREQLDISYYYKENTGPGDSRNYGMQKARGNYFIILDSDVILPKQYLTEVTTELNRDFIDCYGGPDAADESFTTIQKAINFSMTSFLTTGGIRGNATSVSKFEPRSFNMGISIKAFEASNGFGRIHPGEDPDLSIRLHKLGFKTRLFPKAYVYHKRRISWLKFYNQVHKFGRVRPILNSWHPETKKLTYWFPLVFMVGLMISLVCFVFGYRFPLLAYGIYFSLCFISSLVTSKSIAVAVMSIPAVCIQFFGYGWGFLKSWSSLKTSKKSAEDLFPDLFFKT